ncbi:phytosulfokines 3-like [Amaranthus tricolor]|uniref:phytosulfokines 3-like n=1 Tax=Amaranthus tricolor TaxID=29722 RepID=UPI00258D18A0|nr:phytosulfokines 3-like [Amaranthus tricolor]
MAKFFNMTTLLLVMFLLVCTTILTSAARSVPAAYHHEKFEEIKNNVKMDDNIESCEGLTEDECLMRRTLLAHTDYIYTNNHKH